MAGARETGGSGAGGSGADGAAERRKQDHIDVVLAGSGPRPAPGSVVSNVGNGFERVRLVHNALPQISLDAVDLSTRFLGRVLDAPFLISSMTGGPARAERINIHLAEAAQELRIALGVGSQRIALEAQGAGGNGGLTADLRRRAPDVLLLANLGAAQLVKGYGRDEARRAVEMIGADALILHLNPLQEAIQLNGDHDWRGGLERIADLAAGLAVPLVVKEVGFGLSADVARRLADAGVAALDVAGAGGTNWALVEGARGDAHAQAVAQAFAGWGIPTAEAVRQVRAACPDLPLIASGGIGDGVEAAKAIRLGADLVGQAGRVLAAAVESTQKVLEHFAILRQQLAIACFATGAHDLAALKRVPLLED